MKIVAFGYRQNVGKDTAARLLMTQLRTSKLKVSRIGFADRLKELCEDAFGWAGMMPMDFYENHPPFKNNTLPAIGKSPRDIWLRIGKAMNDIHPTVFVHLALQRADCDVLIIPDLRRWEEAEYLDKLPHTYLCKVERDVPRLEDVMPDHPNRFLDKSLETWPRWYRTFNNNGDRRALNEQIRPLAEELLA